MTVAVEAELIPASYATNAAYANQYPSAYASDYASEPATEAKATQPNLGTSINLLVTPIFAPSYMESCPQSCEEAFRSTAFWMSGSKNREKIDTALVALVEKVQRAK
jgi:hypothetical protein